MKDNKKVGAKVLKIAIMGHFAKTKSLLYQVTWAIKSIILGSREKSQVVKMMPANTQRIFPT